jgi:mono/diheme cytochrome c family protein
MTTDPERMRRALTRRCGTWLLALVATAGLAAACTSSDDEAEPRTGSQIYRAVCATCHGRTGQGFVGPSLADVALRFPNVADQVALVANGRGQMPAFRGQLSNDEIEKVIEYTRTGLGSADGTPTTTFIGPTSPSSTSP